MKLLSVIVILTAEEGCHIVIFEAKVNMVFRPELAIVTLATGVRGDPCFGSGSDEL